MVMIRGFILIFRLPCCRRLLVLLRRQPLPVRR